MSADDILKSPVHVAVIKESHVSRLVREGKLKDVPFGLSGSGVQAQRLPRAPTEPEPPSFKNRMSSLVRGSQIRKKSLTRARLRVIYDAVPPLTGDAVPPCESCVAPCCSAFVIFLTPEEYESSFLGEHAVKITPEMQEQFTGVALAPSVVSVLAAKNSPLTKGSPDIHMLEGAIGVTCPFLGEDKRCSIYEHRPWVCRTYTCVGDARITDAMRKGDE